MKPYERQSPTGESGLWHAVVLQAFMDAIKVNRVMSPDAVAYCRARHWLLHDPQDFRDVCDMAGVDAAVIRERAKQKLHK